MLANLSLLDRAQARMDIAMATSKPESHNASEVAEEWPTLDGNARHGLIGDVVATLEPSTEADPAALLVQTMLAFGVMVGKGPHVPIEGDQHHGNLFALMIGNTSKGRKGTSWGRVRQIFEGLPGWQYPASGLSSGEGLKYAVRDATPNTDSTDCGVTDKRLLVMESEFAQVLRTVARPGNTLSPVVREAWDTGNLCTLTKNSPMTATGAHIGIIGHITVNELRTLLTATDCANGFANRFLFVCTRRSKLLPFGGDALDPKALTQLQQRMSSAIQCAQRYGAPLQLTPAARDIWRNAYTSLSEGFDGLLGAVTGRAEAQCIRLSLLYALLDSRTEIDEEHLLAAIALWEYCEASARFVFGSANGNPVADKITQALRAAGESGLTRTKIRDLFGRHKSTSEIDAALSLLARRAMATSRLVPTDGRPTEVWSAVAATNATNAIKASSEREMSPMSQMSPEVA